MAKHLLRLKCQCILLWPGTNREVRGAYVQLDSYPSTCFMQTAAMQNSADDLVKRREPSVMQRRIDGGDGTIGRVKCLIQGAGNRREAKVLDLLLASPSWAR